MPYRYPPECRRKVLDLLAAGRSVVSLSADLCVGRDHLQLATPGRCGPMPGAGSHIFGEGRTESRPPADHRAGDGARCDQARQRAAEDPGGVPKGRFEAIQTMRSEGRPTRLAAGLEVSGCVHQALWTWLELRPLLLRVGRSVSLGSVAGTRQRPGAGMGMWVSCSEIRGEGAGRVRRTRGWLFRCCRRGRVW